MQRESEQNKAPQQDEHPGTKPIAQNPNPRANENISKLTEEPGRESTDIEEEVGTEITDGEDA